MVFWSALKEVMEKTRIFFFNTSSFIFFFFSFHLVKLHLQIALKLDVSLMADSDTA